MKRVSRGMACAWVFLGFGVLAAHASVDYSGRDFKDPFFHYLKAASTTKDASSGEGTFVLEGLVWDSQLPQAIVSGKVLKIGDKLEDWEIIDITNKGVKMRQGQKEIFLPKKEKG